MNLPIRVVDDEPDVAALFRQQFRRETRSGRFTLDFASSAPEALTHVEAAEPCSLILLLSYINMPGMTGLELLPRVKALRPDLPVIMITAYGDGETLRLAQTGGTEGESPKPIDFLALKADIDRRVASRGVSA